MTDNISRMYELAMVKKVGKKYSCKTLDFGACRTQNCDICDKAQDKNYPPFTEFKQLELIKWISLNTRYMWNYIGQTINNSWVLAIDYTEIFKFKSSEHTDFSQALAGLIYELWEDLTDEQKAEIKRILE